MHRFSDAARSAAPVEEVWKLLYDPSRFPEWWQGLEAVEPGAPVAEPEEPRGEEDAIRGAQKTQEPEPVAPAVQQACPATFGDGCSLVSLRALATT